MRTAGDINHKSLQDKRHWSEMRLDGTCLCPWNDHPHLVIPRNSLIDHKYEYSTTIHTVQVLYSIQYSIQYRWGSQNLRLHGRFGNTSEEMIIDGTKTQCRGTNDRELLCNQRWMVSGLAGRSQSSFTSCRILIVFRRLEWEGLLSDSRHQNTPIEG
jgi:hypothetical protein